MTDTVTSPAAALAPHPAASFVVAPTPSAPRVLSIAGTDPTGGAGIQADLKTIGALGGYGMAVVTALVAQNTRGVHSVHVPDVGFLVEQLDAVSDDVAIDAVKLGMLHSTPLIDAVSDWLEPVRPAIVVLDPVMVATSGDRLLDAAAEQAVRELCRRVDLVTPNLAELAVLVSTDRAHVARPRTWSDAIAQARHLATTTGTTVLLKGGHLDGVDCPDAIVTASAVDEVPGRRIATTNTHGTGCSLSSAMATLAAEQLRQAPDEEVDWVAALRAAKAWLTGALEHGAALLVGEGNGPLDHFHATRAALRAVTAHEDAGLADAGLADAGLADAERGAAGLGDGSDSPALAAALDPDADRRDWAARQWTATTALRAEVDALDFLVGLRDGTLDESAFRWYLAQDALYLGQYARVLARASALAPTADEQEFWARSAASALEEEASLHRARLGDDPDAHPEPSATTLAYVNHLAAAADSYGELVAALLPCFWLYSDVGIRLAAANREGHPFGDWLGAYGDPAFAAATAEAIAIVDRAAAATGAAERGRMRRAFARSMQHERDFFAVPTTGIGAA
ncbi:bifunctional hydroxymethylpyrimidine kinase/phosphomethylpyrimidine kinase [Schumannella soli]|uniref:Bifunctional hydroxymethylpyrimidine kinase/phosphomethylpyrimidine kinase n=1 Tax=Schumannella soli TaxID=2590779 RepID=A0A506XVE2_9MICO|nr:bifunctional hydroxymethylpyrimidine kinase/phosphomethylpyrimidine kinase [Schumannella soli]TPW74136.1 bifunctional hydroxymethylpyrimidine kinase/phosphomethylpyrimidine kinase [Schumannella soli]